MKRIATIRSAWFKHNSTSLPPARVRPPPADPAAVEADQGEAVEELEALL
jgi:hypothetical protein